MADMLTPALTIGGSCGLENLMPRINAPTIEQHKEVTRAAILDAAAVAFLEWGLAGTSIGVVADAARIARTTVYEYFPNKEEILRTLLHERIPPLLEKVLDLDQSGSAADRMERMFSRAFDLVEEHRVESILLFRVGRELPKTLRDEMWAILDPIANEISRICIEGVGSGEFDHPDPVTLQAIVADQLVGGIDELTYRGLHEAAAIANARIRFLRMGLGAK